MKLVTSILNYKFSRIPQSNLTSTIIMDCGILLNLQFKIEVTNFITSNLYIYM